MKATLTKNRVVWAVLLIGTALFVTLALSLAQGAVSLSLGELWQAILPPGNSTNQTIIWDLRLPRILAAAIVGAALGMSGALLQGMLRNSLADPFILGISAGAGLIVTLMIIWQVFPHRHSLSSLDWGNFDLSCSDFTWSCGVGNFD
jgi:iron complex transport system permease protein